LIPRFLLLLLLPLLLPSGVRADDGFRQYEATAALVNKEVLFLSDVLREQCLLSCGAMQEEKAAAPSLAEARERLIADTLALQEQGKLGLGMVDNTELASRSAAALARVAGCDSPCRGSVPPAEIVKWVERKLLVRDFLRRRVGVFAEVRDEEVKREFRRRAARAGEAAGLTEERVRQELLEEKIAREVRNWFARAASKAAITLSPMEEK
jgi:hypothetical protein